MLKHESGLGQEAALGLLLAMTLDKRFDLSEPRSSNL